MSQKKKHSDRKTVKTVGREVMERLILSKLYQDKFIVVDEESKKITVDFSCRIAKMYTESSVKDIRDILTRVSRGMQLAGYTVDTVHFEEAPMDMGLGGL